MAVPGRSLAYADQSTVGVGTAIAFALDDGNWTNSPTSFKINRLPPSFTTDGQDLGGVSGCRMVYTLFVRGVNSEGFGAWFPLKWSVTAAGTGRILYGVPVAWPGAAQHALGSAATIFVQAHGRRPTSGLFYINEVAIDGTSSKYGPDFVGYQILINGVANTFFRATEPGWEIILDTNG